MYKRGITIYQIKEKNEKQKVSLKHAQNKAQDYFKEFLNDLTSVFGLQGRVLQHLGFDTPCGLLEITPEQQTYTKAQKIVFQR